MVNIHGRRCRHDDCEKQPTFGLKGQRVRHRILVKVSHVQYSLVLHDTFRGSVELKTKPVTDSRHRLCISSAFIPRVNHSDTLPVDHAIHCHRCSSLMNFWDCWRRLTRSVRWRDCVVSTSMMYFREISYSNLFFYGIFSGVLAVVQAPGRNTLIISMSGVLSP